MIFSLKGTGTKNGDKNVPVLVVPDAVVRPPLCGIVADTNEGCYFVLGPHGQAI